MQNVLKFIEENNMISPGERVGVGVSGGSDSMALLHFLHENAEKLDIEVVAIHIDHGIREESRDEANFVLSMCKAIGVRSYKFRIESTKLAKDRGISVETAAREGRYAIFDSLFKKDVIDKLALAHHLSDQAETILMHIFRGSGMAGARGMEPVRDGRYIRPLLTTSKEEILDYINFNNLDYVEDSSNKDNAYSRNFLRNIVLPEVSKKWPGAIKSICQFGETLKEDDDFISSQVYDDAVIYEEKEAKIPLSYFLYKKPIISRMIIKVLKNIGVKVDFEKKHIDMIMALASGAENGKRASLPFDVVAVKDYEYLTLYNKKVEVPEFSCEFKCGEFEVPTMGKLIVKRVKEFSPKEGVIYIDFRKVPKNAVWRFRRDGDVFTKFGGGTKKLKSFLIDKKVPQRKRDFIPVLADGNNILAIAGLEISESVKLDGAPTACSVEFHF